MKTIEQLFEDWKLCREHVEECTCDIDGDCFFQLTEKEQIEERIMTLAIRLNDFCAKHDLNVAVVTPRIKE